MCVNFVCMFLFVVVFLLFSSFSLYLPFAGFVCLFVFGIVAFSCAFCFFVCFWQAHHCRTVHKLFYEVQGMDAPVYDHTISLHSLQKCNVQQNYLLPTANNV